MKDASWNMLDARKGEMTAEEAEAFADRLEKDAATALGRIIFALGGLERDIGLCVVWAHGGRKIDQMTKKIASASFDKKLEILNDLVDAIFAKQSEQNIAYAAWIVQASAIRLIRNQLVHGRWWFDACQRQIVHISYVPRAPDQYETRFSIAGFEEFLDLIKLRQSELNQLRKMYSL